MRRKGVAQSKDSFYNRTIHSLNDWSVAIVWMDLGDYLQATPNLHELRILTYIAHAPGTSQAELGRVVGLTPAMINTYLRRLVSQGLVYLQPKNGRGPEYHLSLEGERRRSFHDITWLAQLHSIMEAGLADMRARIVAACGQAPSTVMLYGAGETGRVVYLALQQLSNLRLVGVLDDSPEKQGTSFFDIRVEPPTYVLDRSPDVVLITAWAQSLEMQARMVALGAGRGIKVRTLTP